jgi:hypothetical protein
MALPFDTDENGRNAGGLSMNRRPEVVAWGLVGLGLVALVAAGAVALVSASSSSNVAGVGLVFSLCFPTMGAVVIRQRGSHPVGWLLIGIGVSISLHSAVTQWAQTAVKDDPGSLPWGDFAAWVSVWAWIPGWVLATTLLPTLFPDGRPRGGRRRLAWVDAIAVAVLTILTAAFSWHIPGHGFNDTGEGGADLGTLDQIYVVGVFVIAVLTLVSMGSLVVRYRRAGADLRRQIAWVVYGVAVAIVLSLAGAFIEAGVFQVLEACALVGGLAIAMFRYRLYDIGVVVNRTLVYGALTATLAGGYLGSVLLLQLSLRGLTSDNGLAVAGSTLAVAALFRPARARIQAFVDRRFYRRKYDAARTLAAFSAQLRDEVDLGTLTANLSAVVRETMQPAHVSLWLRAQAPKP